jgi:cell division protein FtsQ
LEKKNVRKNRSRAKRKSRKAISSVGTVGLFSVLFTGAGILFLSLLFVLGHDVVTQGSLFEARQILVFGNQHLSEEEILELADIEPGANIFAVNLGKVRKQLLASGWVAEARVGREIPDRLVIRVREHEPAALLDLRNKYVLSREGTVIKRWEETDAFLLPLVTGLTYSDIPLDGEACNESFASLMQALRVAWTDGGALSLARLERIDVDPGLGITLHATGPVKCARIGFAGYDEKYRRIDRLLASLERGPSEPALEIMEIESDSRIVAGPF